MRDQRIDKLAKVLARYSLKLKEGDLFRIASGPAARPLITALYKEALACGAHPYVALSLEEVDETLLRYGSDAQIGYLSPMARQEVDEMHATIRIIASENTRVLSAVEPQKVALRSQAARELQSRVMERAAAETLNWCVTLFPTLAAAQDADMSLEDYAEFVFRAGKLHTDDPVAAWHETEREQQRIADFLDTKSVIRLVAPETDLTYTTNKRHWINASGVRNFPDGEVFSSAEETLTTGHIRYSYPTIYTGREASDVRLWFENGKVVKATAAKGEELLHSLLDMDEGARRLGEVAFGTNYDITRFSRNILFDEKIGGTIHLALGAGYPDTGSLNKSALHWDMICDMREGEAYADGELFYKGGKFLI